MIRSQVLDRALSSCFVNIVSTGTSLDRFAPVVNGQIDYSSGPGGWTIANVGCFVGRSGFYWTMPTEHKLASGERHYLVNPVSKSSWVGRIVGREINDHFAVGYARPHSVSVFPLAKRMPSQGEEVYTIGLVHDQLVPVRGRFRSVECLTLNIGFDVVCDIEVYHGFCGAPLINQAGELLGLGAACMYDSANRCRDFDTGLFMSVRALTAAHSRVVGIRAVIPRLAWHV